jgi:hypothetical protein
LKSQFKSKTARANFQDFQELKKQQYLVLFVTQSVTEMFPVFDTGPAQKSKKSRKSNFKLFSFHF